MSNQIPAAKPQPLWFLALFALAAGGGAIAYVPFLTVLLPLKITALVGSEDVPALARVTFYGAVVASIANIVFGMLSDRSKTRLPWIVTGLISSGLLMIAVDYVGDVNQLILLTMAWQVALNMMLGPLMAWAGDLFPDSQKGMLGGALSFAPALGALSGSFVTIDALVPAQSRLAVVASLVAMLILPAIIAGRSRTRPQLMESCVSQPAIRDVVPHSRRTLAVMWAARFLVQIAEAGLFAFMLFWLRSIQPNFHENSVANTFSAILVLSVPLTLLLGRWSDRARRPILPLTASAFVSAIGLVIMAWTGNLTIAVAGFVIFGSAASVFLSLHSAQTLRVLPEPRHRGRDMGVFNLTNTVPSLVMPWLTLALVPGFGFTVLFALFAVLSIAAGALLMTIPVRK
ncbi:MFS transporter [Erythrobacter sp. SCSIO 43205]|uniref:MFS transporter n=1 Tax=Erythrobacter sp. SCSIO 43205 TaxID=2779361 RepID=UPI001CA84CD0|nr:MFS transporter [Erythrobacter sp. SCSIO 43205]UAB77668.1 MFS transporter [Erythrobacter sp. SCSIO 43205]